MFRALVLQFAAVALVAVVAQAVEVWTGANLHEHEMLTAALVALIASELAMLPLFLSTGQNQATLSQAALMATGVHMLLAAGIGGVVSFKIFPGNPFLYWMCGFYWATLISVAYVSVRTIRKAPVALTDQRPTTV